MSKSNGRSWLLFAGIAEIIIGALSLFLIFSLLTSGEGGNVLHSIEVYQEALWNLVLLYGLCAFKIIAGALAVIFSNKPSKNMLLTVLGGLLMLAAFTSMSHGNSATDWAINFFTLLVPCLYVYGASAQRMSLK